MPVLCKKRKTVFTLPDDLITEIASFLWTDCTIHANELSADIDFYITWRTLVPPIFIKCAVADKLHCYDVANPMRAGHPYWPRQLLELNYNGKVALSKIQTSNVLLSPGLHKVG